METGLLDGMMNGVVDADILDPGMEEQEELSSSLLGMSLDDETLKALGSIGTDEDVKIEGMGSSLENVSFGKCCIRAASWESLNSCVAPIV
jgi:hypothetical protein